MMRLGAVLSFCLVPLFSLACSGGEDDTGPVDAGTGGTDPSGSGGAVTGGTQTEMGGAMGGTGGSATASGGTGAGSTQLAEDLAKAELRCEISSMGFAANFSGTLGVYGSRLIEGGVTASGATEVLHHTTGNGDEITLTWSTVADGEITAATGFVLHNDSDGTVFRRCIEGQVQVRTEIDGDIYYLVVSEAVFEAAEDGTCGAPAEGYVRGCIADEY